MKSQIIELEKLTPDEGKMLYNAAKDIYAKTAYLGLLDDPADWTERPVADYEAWLEEQEKQQAAEPEEKA